MSQGLGAITSDRGLLTSTMRAIPPFLLIALGGFLAHSNSMHNPFVFDDVDAIVQNPHLRTLWPPGAALAAPPGSGASGRPLVALSLAVNHALGGLDPIGYHAFNLLVHVLAAGVLFTLVRGTLRLPPVASKLGGHADGIALAVSLIWIVHPLHTAVQDHVIYRNESMAALCLLVVLECVRRAATATRHVRWWSTVAVLANAAGMACKETMVVTPLLALLYDRTFLSGSMRRALESGKGLYTGLAAGWIILAACIVTGDRGASVTQHYADVTRLDYARTQLGVVAHYLRLAFWPRPLVLDYDWPIAHDFAAVALPSLLIGTLLVATLVAVFRRSGYGFLGAVFLLVLAPSSTVVPLTGAIAAEHRMYLPLAAVAVTAVGLVHTGLERIGVFRSAAGRGLLVAMVAGLVLILGESTRTRNRDYTTTARIWRVTAEAVPRNPRAHGNLGAALLLEGRFDGAVRALQAALNLQPDYPGAGANLALAHRSLGFQYAASGSPDSAVVHLRTATQVDPDDRVALNALAWILSTSPDSSLRDPAAAISYAERAVRSRAQVPPEFLDTLAAAHAATGDYDGALREATRARALALRAGKIDLADKIAARISSYASGNPIVESNSSSR